MRRYKAARMLVVVVLLVSCKPSSQVRSAEVNKACGNNLTGATDDNEVALQGEAQITFYKDIYPIVTSAKTGRVYKCVTCHASYFEPNGLASVTEIESAVASMRSGRMPVGGDKVDEHLIQTFIDWRLTGFAIGDPSQIPEGEIDPSVYTRSGCN